MPTLVGRSKWKDFNYILDRVRKKFNRWKEQNLIYVGKTILIQVVAQAIPTDTMSVFRVSDSLCQEIDSVIRIFFCRELKIKLGRFVGRTERKFEKKRTKCVWVLEA